MTALEIMKELYPKLPLWQRSANAAWLDAQAQWIIDGGYVTSPRDRWVVRKIKQGNYEIVARLP